MPDKALRYNSGKAELSYLLDLPHALEALVRVYEQGAIKYARGNWKKGGKPDGEYLDSALRHMMAHANEGNYDSDIGTVHIANAVWNLLALIELNMKDVPALDPDFDQEAFKAKYAKNGVEDLLKTITFESLRAEPLSVEGTHGGPTVLPRNLENEWTHPGSLLRDDGLNRPEFRTTIEIEED